MESKDQNYTFRNADVKVGDLAFRADQIDVSWWEHGGKNKVLLGCRAPFFNNLPQSALNIEIKGNTPDRVEWSCTQARYVGQPSKTDKTEGRIPEK